MKLRRRKDGIDMKDNLVLLLICLLSAIFMIAFIYGIVFIILTIMSYNFILGIIALCLFLTLSMFVKLKFS